MVETRITPEAEKAAFSEKKKACVDEKSGASIPCPLVRREGATSVRSQTSKKKPNALREKTSEQPPQGGKKVKMLYWGKEKGEKVRALNLTGKKRSNFLYRKIVEKRGGKRVVGGALLIPIQS